MEEYKVSTINLEAQAIGRAAAGFTVIRKRKASVYLEEADQGLLVAPARRRYLKARVQHVGKGQWPPPWSDSLPVLHLGLYYLEPIEMKNAALNKAQ